MAISDKPWSQFSQADYMPEQMRRACLIHIDPNSDNKADHKLPVREPDGTLNRNGVHAAAAVLAGERGGVDAPPAQTRAAARQLIRFYREMNEDPSESLRRLAE